MSDSDAPLKGKFTYKGKPVTVISGLDKPLARIIDERGHEYTVPTIGVKETKPKQPRYHLTSYVEALIKARTPEKPFQKELSDWREFILRLLDDENMNLNYSANPENTIKFGEIYQQRRGLPLPAKVVERNQTSTAPGNKCNTVISPKTKEGLVFEGVEWEPFFGGPLLVAHESRAGIWWALIDAGFQIGNHSVQNRSEILRKLENNLDIPSGF